MKVLGIEASTKGVHWAILEGTRKRPTLVKMPKTKHKVDVGDDETAALYEFFKLMRTFLEERKIERVAILVAGTKRFGGAPSVRPKIEAMVQLAAADRTNEVALIAPQSLRAQEKKFAEVTGEGSPEACFNEGSDFKPREWKDSILAGWCGLGE